VRDGQLRQLLACWMLAARDLFAGQTVDGDVVGLCRRATGPKKAKERRVVCGCSSAHVRCSAATVHTHIQKGSSDGRRLPRLIGCRVDDGARPQGRDATKTPQCAPLDRSGRGVAQGKPAVKRATE
jgi:hypothetical protein